MSNFPAYKTKTFSPTQKFFVLDPNTGSPAFVQGSDLIAQITPSSNYVYAEATRTTAQATDYPVGALIETAGATSAGDNFAAVYLVVESGAGDFPMNNGNELLVIKGDELLRQQLATKAAGEGSDLVVKADTGETVTAALNQRTIYVGSVAELEALSLSDGTNVYLTEDGRSGEFVVKTGAPPSDPKKGVYIVLANGNYAERQFQGPLQANWFGAVPSDPSVDNGVAFRAANALAKLLRYSAESQIGGVFVTERYTVSCKWGRYFFDTPINNLNETVYFDFSGAILTPGSGYVGTDYLFSGPGNVGWRLNVSHFTNDGFDYIFDINNGNLDNGQLDFEYIKDYGSLVFLNLNARSSITNINAVEAIKTDRFLNVINADHVNIENSWLKTINNMPDNYRLIDMAAGNNSASVYMEKCMLVPQSSAVGADKATMSWVRVVSGYFEAKNCNFGGEDGGIPVVQSFATLDLGRGSGAVVDSCVVNLSPVGFPVIALHELPSTAKVVNCRGLSREKAIDYANGVDPTTFGVDIKSTILSGAYETLARYSFAAHNNSENLTGGDYVNGYGCNRLPDDLNSLAMVSSTIAPKPLNLIRDSLTGENVDTSGNITLDLAQLGVGNSAAGLRRNFYLDVYYTTEESGSASYKSVYHGRIYFVVAFNGSALVHKAIVDPVFTYRGGPGGTEGSPITASVSWQSTGIDELTISDTNMLLTLNFDVKFGTSKVRVRANDQGTAFFN